MMNRFVLFGIATSTALSLFPRILQAEEKTEPERLATAPSGKFYLISIPAVDDVGNEAGERLALVPTNDPKTPVPFPISGKVDAKTSVGFAFISPDESWILSQQSFCRIRLYRRTDELRYALAETDCLDQDAWHFLAQQENVEEKLIGVAPTRGGPGQRSIDFVQWSADSARLLICLNATIGLPDKETDDFKAGVASWLCYFNIKTRNFELTDRLREANRGARKRWRSDDFSPSNSTLPLSAECLGQEGPWTPAPKRFERADKRLNEIYAARLKQLAPAAREKLRQEQREWLIQRDTDAAVYANQRWSPFGEAALMEGQAIATEARVAELEKKRNP